MNGTSTARVVQLALVVLAGACEPRLAAEPATVAAPPRARSDHGRQPETNLLADRLAGARLYRRSVCGGNADGPAAFLREPEIVAWTAAEPRAVASDGGVVCWVEDGKPQRILAVSAAGGPPRQIATSPGIRDLHAHRGAVFWSDGDRVLRTAITGGDRTPILEGGRLAVRGDLVLAAREEAIWISALDGAASRRLAMLPPQHTVDDLALADDAAWALVSEPDGVAAILLRIDLATGAVDERARTRLGSAVAVAREHVVFSTLTETWQVPRAGGPSSRLSVFPGDASDLFAAGDVVLGVSDCGGTLTRIEAARGVVDVLASGLGVPQGVAVDGRYIVWADLIGDSRGVVVRMPLGPP